MRFTHITGAVGLAAAIDYLEAVGWESLRAHETALADTLQAELDATPRVRSLMARAPARIALGSFTLSQPGLAAEHLSLILSDTHNIMVRAGYHCAHPLFHRDGHGTAVRVSASLYNSPDELRTFGEALRRVLLRFSS